MDHFLIYGVLSIAGVQFLALIHGAIIYSRQKSAVDVEVRDRQEFRPLVQKALALAGDALAGVERVDVEQYKTLAKKLGEAHAEIEFLRAKITALEGSIASAHNKLASYAKQDKRVEKEERAQPADNGKSDFVIPEGVDPLEWMKAQGIAQPMGDRVGFQQQTLPIVNNMPRGFGRKVQG